MAIALDSNILIDVLGQPTEHTPHAVETLNAALTRGALIICPIVAAETSLYFASADETEDTFKRMQIRLSPFGWRDLHLAGRIFWNTGSSPPNPGSAWSPIFSSPPMRSTMPTNLSPATGDSTAIISPS